MALINGIGLNNQFHQPKPNPDKDAQDYADKNNISLEAAKAALKQKYGDPPKDDGKAGGNNDISSIFKKDSTQPPINTNPDDYAEIYAKLNNITVEEAKKELKQKYGEPQQKTEGGSLNLIA